MLLSLSLVHAPAWYSKLAYIRRHIYLGEQESALDGIRGAEKPVGFDFFCCFRL